MKKFKLDSSMLLKAAGLVLSLAGTLVMGLHEEQEMKKLIDEAVEERLSENE